MGVYGLRTAAHAAIWWRRKAQWLRPSEERAPLLEASPSSFPHVVVQLPIYNEHAVAARAIHAAAALDWPRDRLVIQVLDDSTDETCAIIDTAAATQRRKGIDVRVLRRRSRAGFKGGALAIGTAAASSAHTSPLLAILDADFVPEPEWLRRMVPHLLADPGLACLQSRWGHRNEDERPLTRAQGLALDAYFVVEQSARSAAGWCLNFNGSGGIWRAEAIRAAGGWRGDTLTEDVDLSYRAQLVGWRIGFRPEIEVPGELPTTMCAFQRQQRRWARGTIQCLIRLAPAIVRSEWSVGRKAHALLSLSNHLVQPALLLLLLGAPALLWWQPALHPMLLLLTAVSLGQPGVVAAAQTWLHGRKGRALMWSFGWLAILGAGMVVNGSLAVWRGAFAGPGTFERTPKRGEGMAPGEGTQTSALAPKILDAQSVAELGLAAWAAAGLGLALSRGAWGSVPFLMMFALGLAWTGGATTWERYTASHASRRRAIVGAELSERA